MVRTFFALGGLMLCLGLFSCYDENGTYGYQHGRSDLGIDRLVGDIW